MHLRYLRIIEESSKAQKPTNFKSVEARRKIKLSNKKVCTINLAHTARFLSLRSKILSLRTKIFVAGDENLLCAGNTYKRFLSLTTIFNMKYTGNSFSSLTTEDTVCVASDKNRAVCARL